jgi:hypothetical protein
MLLTMSIIMIYLEAAGHDGYLVPIPPGLESF